VLGLSRHPADGAGTSPCCDGPDREATVGRIERGRRQHGVAEVVAGAVEAAAEVVDGRFGGLEVEEDARGGHVRASQVSGCTWRVTLRRSRRRSSFVGLHNYQ
jgi:hypothetical protein